MSFVVVWRAAEGAAVNTFAHADKRPRVFEDDATEAQGVHEVDADALTALLAAREPFDPKRVDTKVASTLLGWEV